MSLFSLSPPEKFNLNLHWITVFSLVYLAIPCMLFFSSWFTPWIAWPVNLGIIFSLFIFARQKIETIHWQPDKLSWGLIILTFPLCIALFLSTGMAGYVTAAPDVLIFREALYNNLIHEAWPVVLPNGKEMSYYLAGMLPPALVSRLTEDYTLQRLIAVIWYALGIWLTLLLFFCRHRRFSCLFLVFIIMFKDPAYLCINAFAGNGEIWRFFTQFISVSWENTYIGAAHPVKMLGIHAQGCNFQSFSLLCAALILNSREQSSKLIPLCITLILPSSPLASIACMPLGVYFWWKDRESKLLKRLQQLIVPVLIALCCAVYYGRADSATCFGLYGKLLNNWSFFLYNFYSAILLSAILFGLVLYPVLKRDVPLQISLICVIVTPWIFYGSAPDSGMFGQNELWLKSSIIFHMHLIAALCFHWKELPCIKYAYIITFAMLVCKDERIKQAGYSGSPEVQDVWGGHLNHEHVSLYQKIPDCRSPYIPGSILQKGEAENIWPGCILPKARGCDYSRPMKPDGKYVSY